MVCTHSNSPGCQSHWTVTTSTKNWNDLIYTGLIAFSHSSQFIFFSTSISYIPSAPLLSTHLFLFIFQKNKKQCYGWYYAIMLLLYSLACSLFLFYNICCLVHITRLPIKSLRAISEHALHAVVCCWKQSTSFPFPKYTGKFLLPSSTLMNLKEANYENKTSHHDQLSTGSANWISSSCSHTSH